MQPKMSAAKWIAAKYGDVTVLFNVGNEDNLLWVEKAHGEGKSREEAITDLRKKLPNGNGNL